MKNQSLLEKVWKYMKHSSLFIFHETWRFRQFLVLLVVNSDQLTTKMPLNLINEMKINNDVNNLIGENLLQENNNLIQNESNHLNIQNEVMNFDQENVNEENKI